MFATRTVLVKANMLYIRRFISKFEKTYRSPTTNILLQLCNEVSIESKVRDRNK